MLAMKWTSLVLLMVGVPSLPHAYGAGQQRSDESKKVARGQAIVEGKGACLSCHRVADQGSHLGPDLSAIGLERTVDVLRKAILDPGLEVQPQNRLYQVVTRDGMSITGKLLNQDLYSVQMLDSQDRLLRLSKKDLRDYNFTTTTAMPSYRSKLSEAEQSDLLAYLVSLKGVVRQ